MATMLFSSAAQLAALRKEREARYIQEKAFFQHLFEEHAEETITDEQVERVLAPVLAMIRAGKFSHPQAARRMPIPLRIAAAGVALAGCLGLGVSFAKGRAQMPSPPAGRDVVRIQDSPVPLAGAPASQGAHNSLSGAVALPGDERHGVLVRLVNTETDEIVSISKTDASGNYCFEGFPDGAYRVEVATHTEDASTAQWVEPESAYSHP